MARLIEIPYKPRNWAKLLHGCKKRWMVLVLHRRAGKTTAVLNHLQRSALQNPKTRYAYIAPTYKQAKLIAWDIIKQYSQDIPGIKYNEAELKVTYPNNSTLHLFGSENVDSLRGIALWGVGLDEHSQQPSNLFSEVISKCLADNLGYCVWLGTPKGKNQFYRTYENAKNNDDWLAIFKKISDSLEEEEGEVIENLRVAYKDDKRLVEQNQMTQEEFDQEWNCSFQAAIKGAYYAREIAYLRESGRYKFVPYDMALKVYTVCDLGVGQNLAVGFYQKVANEIKMIDYWQGENNEGLVHAIREIKNKPYVYGKHFAPHDINAREEMTGKTRIESAKELGIHYEVVPSVPVDDGINKGKLFFSRLWVSTKCEVWLDAVTQYHREWDDKRGEFKKNPYHDWTSHPCLIAGTKILTNKGEKEIEAIRKGDFVKTPMGLKKVLWAGQTGETDKLIEIDLGKTKIVSTHNHKFFTTRGFVYADELRYNDSIINLNYTICKSSLLYSKAKSIGFREAITEQKIGEKELVIYTEQFGKMLMDKFQKVAIFITETVIQPIIGLRIWNVLMGKSIIPYTLSIVNGLEVRQIGNNYEVSTDWLKSGIKVQLVGNGTENTLKTLGKTKKDLLLKKIAYFAGKNLKHILPIKVNTATRIIKLRRLENGIKKIYDLEVEKDHCYYANGHLVSNSDVHRYAALVEDQFTNEDETVLQTQVHSQRTRENIYDGI